MKKYIVKNLTKEDKDVLANQNLLITHHPNTLYKYDQHKNDIFELYWIKNKKTGKYHNNWMKYKKDNLIQTPKKLTTNKNIFDNYNGLSFNEITEVLLKDKDVKISIGDIEKFEKNHFCELMKH